MPKCRHRAAAAGGSPTPTSALNNVELPRHSNLGRAVDRQAQAYMGLEAVGAAHRAHPKPSERSGGSRIVWPSRARWSTTRRF